jgi:acyl-CoA synthetase (NDP forming)
MVAGQSSEYRAAMILDAIEGSTKPIVTWWAAGSLSDPGINALYGSNVTLFRSPDRCAAAVTALVKYYQHLATCPPDKITRIDTGYSPSPQKAGAMLQTADSSLSEHQSKALLNLYGIPVTREIMATSVTDAVGFAEEIGFPVVLKVDSPDILHKSEANAIRVGVGSVPKKR